MKPTRFGFVLAVLGLLAVACGAAAGGTSPGGTEDPGNEPASDQEAPMLTYTVLREHPHDTSAFTQGLTYHDGYLYEGTGRRGQSTVRRVEIDTGRVVQRADISPVLFGEGITILDGLLYQLTWTSGVGFVYDLETFEVLRQFRQFTRGWGLTSDGEHLILSDGTTRVYFIDPDTMQEVRSIRVHDDDGFIDQINELEYVDGEIYANVWHSWHILRISPRDGRVIGRIDMNGIFDTMTLPDPESVLNGIAYDPDTGRTWVTGKLWPKLFEVRFVEQ